MGGGNSVEDYKNIVLRSTVDIITQTTQSIGRNAMQNQKIYVNCKEFYETLGNQYVVCLKQYIDAGRPSEDAKNACKELLALVCGIDGVAMDQALYIRTDTDQISTIKTDVTQKLKNDLISTIESNTGFLQFGNKYKAQLDLLIDQTTRAWQQIDMNTLVKNLQNQELKLENGTVRLVTMRQASDQITRELQQNQSYMSVVNEVANLLQQEFKSSTNWQTILIIVGSIVAGILIIALIIFFVRRARRGKQQTGDKGGVNVNVTVGGKDIPRAAQ